VYVHNGFAITGRSKPNLSFYERSGKNPIIFVRYERTELTPHTRQTIKCTTITAVLRGPIQIYAGGNSG